MPKEITLGDIFTSQELAKVIKLYEDMQAHASPFAERIRVEYIEPKLAHINNLTGQVNDSHFWAYLVEYYISKLKDEGSI